jgi:oligoribonuclease NrnB/cAMP/cGMP phosphodiesterase (DHH superfamily)
MKVPKERRMKMKVLYHDNCFDGAASAAVFSRFYKSRIQPDASFVYEGLSHQAGGSAVPEGVFTGDENVIVDFRYSQSPRLTWWFDHHKSAFQQPGDEAHFRADKGGKKFHDATRKSCTKYIADTTKAKFGFDPAPLTELIDWADLIDAARFQSPKMAVELKEPALKLMTVLEANKDPRFIPSVITDMQEKPLAEIVARKDVQAALTPLLERHQHAIEAVRKKAKLERGVVFFDVADEGFDSINKFISYYLYPDARYTVWVGKGTQRAKVSIGSNPWRPELRTHDLASIAERYGGGGHPVVAAMSFTPDELEKARKAAAEILGELRAGA